MVNTWLTLLKKKLKEIFKSKHENSLLDGGYNSEIAYVKAFN